MLARLLGLLVLLATTATAAVPVTQPLRISQSVLQMTDTFRAQMLAMLARGDIQGAIALYQLETGRQTLPKWGRVHSPPRDGRGNEDLLRGAEQSG